MVCSLNILVSVEEYVKEMHYLHYYISSSLIHLLKKSESDNIAGIKVNHGNDSVDLKICQYVDDTSVFLQSKEYIRPFLNEVNTYSKISGAKLNVEKTVGIVTHPNNAGTHHGIRFGIGPERVLGIPIGTNRCNTDFWDQLLHKLRSKLSVWKHRDLSFEGKVHLIKSIGISQLTYAMDMMNVEDKVISETDRIIYQFLCSDKRYTIKKDVYTLPRNMGGLRMIDVLALIKAKIIKFIIQVLKRAEQKWAKLPLNISNAWIMIFVYPFFTDGTRYYRIDWKEKYSPLL